MDLLGDAILDSRGREDA